VERISSFHSIHNLVDRGVRQAMWEELASKVDTVINSLSANHTYLITLYGRIEAATCCLQVWLIVHYCIAQWKKNRSERRKHCSRAGCSKVRTPPAHPPAVTNPQTGPITIHCAAASAQCN